MKPLCVALLLAIGAVVATASCAQVAGAVPAAPAASAVPATRPLFAVEIRIGTQWNGALPAGQQALMREHSAHLRRLRDEGRLRVGARYGEVGLIVLEAASIDEARAWMDADPSVRGGTFRFEVFPLSVFYGGTLSR